MNIPTAHGDFAVRLRGTYVAATPELALANRKNKRLSPVWIPICYWRLQSDKQKFANAAKKDFRIKGKGAPDDVTEAFNAEVERFAQRMSFAEGLLKPPFTTHAHQPITAIQGFYGGYHQVRI